MKGIARAVSKDKSIGGKSEGEEGEEGGEREGSGGGRTDGSERVRLVDRLRGVWGKEDVEGEQVEDGGVARMPASKLSFKPAILSWHDLEYEAQGGRGEDGGRRGNVF